MEDETNDNIDEGPRDPIDDHEAEYQIGRDEAERRELLTKGFRILKTMYQKYIKCNPGETPTWLKDELDDLKDEIKGKYALFLSRTPEGIKITRGPGRGTNWRGKTLKRCPCRNHQRLFRVLDSRDLSEAKQHHSARVLELYWFLNPRDRGCACKITIEEREGDIIKLTWTGPKPDWENVRHHISNCLRWLYEKPKYKNRRSKPPNMQ